ncbi:phage tail-collar fiber domain-containing protein [Citrobacter koseri]|uniref:phage tail-collar fiber domain-containing protein n=1 Tax=Citrobacter koseri TaxID=545 RepID=UPI001E293DAB|nr:phage tail protein [Citrobacter koseri]
MADYYSIITNRGKELEAEALASGTVIVLSWFVVGDGNGKLVKPNPAQTRLVNETYRGSIAELVVSPDQSNQLMAKIVLPTDAGGFTVREVGLLTDAGELYAVANCPTIDKPVGGVSVNMQFRLAVSDTSNITLEVATGDGLFLRIDQNLKEIKARGAAAQKASRESIGVVDATTKQKGLVQLNSATNSTSENQAATPAAVKAANDNANARIKTDALTTSREDTVAGHVLQVGDYGLGVANGTTRYLNSIYDIKCAGFYNALGSGTDNPTTGIPDNSGNTRFGVSAVNIYSNQYLVTLTSNVHFYVGLVNTASKTSTWSKFYNTLNKPTAADVSAVPTSRKVNGRALTTDINVTSQDIFNGQSIDIGANQNLDNYQTPGIYAQPQNANTSAALNYPENYAGALMVLKGAGVTQIYYVYNSSRIWTRSKYGTGAWTAWAREYNTLNKPSAADVGALPSNGNAVSASKLQTARTINGVAFDGTKNITISAGSVGSYTKAESDARYVQNIRVSATQTRAFRDGGGWSPNDTAFAVAIQMVGGSSNVGSLMVRYVQKLVNGTWVNITT